MTVLGKLFVLEGPDGVGKTTLSQHLATRLSKHQSCLELSFPGKRPGTLGRVVYDLHHKHRECGVNTIVPTSKQLLHVAAHIDEIEQIIVPALQSGQIVILDRFWWSTWVYGVETGANRRALRTMIQLEKTFWGTLLPAAVFLITREQLTRGDTCVAYGRRLALYQNIVSQQKLRHPIHLIHNDSSVAAAADRMAGICLDDARHSHLPAAIASGPRRPADNLNEGSPNGHSTFTRKEAHDNGLLFSPQLDVKSVAPQVFSKLSPAKTTVVYDTYWRFAEERQAIFFRRLRNESPPWTEDPILRVHKFTNAYRASDRVSQYLIRHVIYKGDPTPVEMFFRTLLFKLFNKIETWELLCETIGEVRFADYDFATYDRILTDRIESGRSIYSGAYIMPSGRGAYGFDKKHRTHLKLVERMMEDALPTKMADLTSMHQAFELVKEYPTIGDFLAYQYVTDINYGTITNFDEISFVVPRPGSLDGLRKCFSDPGGLNGTDLIKMVTDRQEVEFDRLELKFQTLWGRRLQLIDCQNLFCEVDKYSRIKHPEVQGITGRTRIKQKFRAKPEKLDIWYPPKWCLNDKIQLWSKDNVSAL